MVIQKLKHFYPISLVVEIPPLVWEKMASQDVSNIQVMKIKKKILMFLNSPN